MRHVAQHLEQQGQLTGLLAYTGPSGRLRVSRRALDPAKSTDLEPYLAHDREEPVKAGTPVQVDLGLWPTGMLLHPGETLVVEIAGHFAGPLKPAQVDLSAPPPRIPTGNAGNHIIHTGGQFDSQIFLPIAR